MSILGAGGGVVAAVAAALLLNARYAAIGVAIGPSFRGPLWRRLVESQLIVDESWALSVDRDGVARPAVLVGAGTTLWIVWTGGTIIGGLAGGALGDPATLGLDGAFPALFLALLAPQVRDRRADPACSRRRTDSRRDRGLPRRLESTMRTAWLAVTIVGAGTVLLKSTGRVLFAGRSLPRRWLGLLRLLAPALLAALVVTQTFGAGRSLALDPRAAGLGAAVAAVLLRAPLLLVIVVAAVATALVRALS